MTTPHHKTKKTYNVPGHAHFLTYSCAGRLPLLSKDRSRQWVVDAINEARVVCDFDVWAYVIMPEHVHLLIWPRQAEYKMSRILAALKRPVSAKAKAYLRETGNDEWLKRLTVRKSGKEIFRFWLAGGGYDKNLCEVHPIFEVIDYLHGNPVRRELVEYATDWLWSSARFWAGETDVPLLMDQMSEVIG